MKTVAILSLAILAAGAVGCACPRGRAPAAAQAASVQSADATADVAPADPVYLAPAIPGGSEELAATLAGPFRERGWAVRTARYAHGVTTHMPRWFADPYDDVTRPQGNNFGWSCDDLLAVGYCPARAGVNFVALPLTAVVHPLCCERAGTDQTPTIERTARGVEVR